MALRTPFMFRGLSRIGLWRLAAIVLLLGVGFDLLAVDSGLWSACATAACCDDSTQADACFCCCAHVVVTRLLEVSPGRVATAFEQHATAAPASIPPHVPELPPRA
jgi:hypothetical protein